MPLAVHAELNADPKAIDDFPKAANLDAMVTTDGKFVVSKFSVSH
ncbi:MAG: hypothetical protein P4L99_13770 [Chthoniobacter sp.]|nr:hypothetical protein [Chthoniobacter sp.]